MKQAIMTTQGNIEFRNVDAQGKLVTKEILLKILPVFILVFPGVITFCFDFEPISGYMYLTKGWHIPFMMQAWWLFVICSIIYFMVSYLMQNPPKEITELLHMGSSFCDNERKNHIGQRCACNSHYSYADIGHFECFIFIDRVLVN
jgi:hypothetical protein